MSHCPCHVYPLYQTVFTGETCSSSWNFNEKLALSPANRLSNVPLANLFKVLYTSGACFDDEWRMSYLSLEIRQALAHSCYKPFLEHVRKTCLFHGCFVFHESSKQRLKTMCVLYPEIEHFCKRALNILFAFTHIFEIWLSKFNSVLVQLLNVWHDHFPQSNVYLNSPTYFLLRLRTKKVILSMFNFNHFFQLIPYIYQHRAVSGIANINFRECTLSI